MSTNCFSSSSNTAFPVVNWCCINISSRKVYFLDFWKKYKIWLGQNHIEPSKMLENDIFIQKRGKITPSKIKQKLNWDKNRNYENVPVIIFNPFDEFGTHTVLFTSPASRSDFADSSLKNSAGEKEPLPILQESIWVVRDVNKTAGSIHHTILFPNPYELNQTD